MDNVLSSSKKNKSYQDIYDFEPVYEINMFESNLIKEKYEITEDENGNSTDGLGELIIAKNRSGTLKSIFLEFQGEFTKFRDINAAINSDAMDYGKITLPGGAGDTSHFDNGIDWSPPTMLSKANDLSSEDPLSKAGPEDEVPF